jgi:hypothetical protein
MSDDPYWFLKPPAEIEKMRKALPPVFSDSTQAFIDAYKKADSRGVGMEFVEAFLGYMNKPESDIMLALEFAEEDWEIE